MGNSGLGEGPWVVGRPALLLIRMEWLIWCGARWRKGLQKIGHPSLPPIGM